ncbi:hypothetical protein HDU81_010819 [Chytriomyces hyalinus]|nr:hypothetical protein HDU81_010819 [Chytriomyces hyalinus]
MVLLFVLACGNDFLPSLEETSFKALWTAYQDVINSMAETDDKSVLYLLDVPAGKLNLETFARVLGKAQQSIMNKFADIEELMPNARLNKMTSSSKCVDTRFGAVGNAIRNNVAKHMGKTMSVDDSPAQKPVAKPVLSESNVSHAGDLDIEAIANKCEDPAFSLAIAKLLECGGNNHVVNIVSLWSLMRTLFPQAIIKDCSSVHAAAERAASSSRLPYSSNLHALVDVNSLLRREARSVENTPSGARMLAHVVRWRLDDAIRDLITSRKNPRQNPMTVASFSLNFTPGSTFMMTLDAVVADHICYIADRHSALRECIYSGSRVPGEGDTKIVEHMLRQASRPWNMGDFFLILTGSSDAILHLLLAPPEFRTGIVDLDERVAFLPANMEEHLAPLFPNSEKAPTDVHHVQQDLALLFLLAFGNDHLSALENASFNALWIAYQDIINSMAKVRDSSVLYLLDVPAAKLKLETLALILEKAEQLVTDGIVDLSGRVSDANLSTLEADEHSSHVHVSMESESSEDNGPKELDTVRKDQSTRSIDNAPPQKKIEVLS